MKAIALAVRSPICYSCFRRSFLLISLLFLLVCFAPCQMALAVSPAPDGGYAGNNTAEGTSALFSLTSGADNTRSVIWPWKKTHRAPVTQPSVMTRSRNNVDGSFNVAVGDEAGSGLGASVNNVIAIGVTWCQALLLPFDNTCFIGSIFGEPVSDPGSQVLSVCRSI